MLINRCRRADFFTAVATDPTPYVQLCGRRWGNPRHHPVLPWVRDLNQAEGGWRDLGRSKMRLTRGDRQLDVTYESVSTSKASLPLGHTPVDRAVQVAPSPFTLLLVSKAH